MKRCKFCGTDLPVHANFCGNCGRPLAERTPVAFDYTDPEASATPAPNTPPLFSSLLYAIIVNHARGSHTSRLHGLTAIFHAAFLRMWVEQATSLFWSATCRYLFSGSGCRAATTPPRAAAERLAQTARFARSLCAAGRGATRRSATSSTTLNRYHPIGEPFQKSKA